MALLRGELTRQFREREALADFVVEASVIAGLNKPSELMYGLSVDMNAYDAVLGNMDLLKQGMNDDHGRSVQVLMESSGFSIENILAGRRGVTGVDIARHVAQLEQEKSESRVSDAMFLALLNNIEARIEELGDLIDEIDTRIAAIDDLLLIIERDGQLDPTDPEQMLLLAATGIDPDKWHEVDEDFLRDERAGNVIEKTEAERQLDGLRVLHSELSHKEASGTLVESDIQNYNDQAVELGLLSAEVYREEETELSANGYNAAVRDENTATVDTVNLSAFGMD